MSGAQRQKPPQAVTTLDCKSHLRIRAQRGSMMVDPKV